jgi:hypothetical protein
VQASFVFPVAIPLPVYYVVRYTELVSAIENEPNYDAVLAALKAI